MIKFLKRLLGKSENGVEQEKTEQTKVVDFSSEKVFQQKEKKKYYWPGKAPTILVDGESKRLFSTSMLTRNKEARLSGPKPKQLEKYQLPLLRTERELADWLGLTNRSELYFFSNHRFDDRVSHYVQFAVPKRTGGERIIMAPKRGLKKLQRQVKSDIVDQFPLHEASHGFRTGRSIVTHAQPHVGQPVLVKFDLADFFGSVTFARVRGFFVHYGYDYVIATSLALLCTEAERQRVELPNGEVRFVPIGHRYCVQGAPTSPGLCNAISHKMDARLSGYAKSAGWVYTRYADDMTFSTTNANVSKLLGVVRAIVEEEGFKLNAKKTKVMRQTGAQRVTGLIVNDVLSVPRKDRRAMRAKIHQWKKSQDPKEREEIAGFLSFVSMVNENQAIALRRELES